jgi:hypothetical protein
MLVRRCVGVGTGLLTTTVATKERSEIDIAGALHVIALLSVHTPSIISLTVLALQREEQDVADRGVVC